MLNLRDLNTSLADLTCNSTLSLTAKPVRLWSEPAANLIESIAAANITSAIGLLFSKSLSSTTLYTGCLSISLLGRACVYLARYTGKYVEEAKAFEKGLGRGIAIATLVASVAAFILTAPAVATAEEAVFLGLYGLMLGCNIHSYLYPPTIRRTVYIITPPYIITSRPPGSNCPAR